MNDENLIDIWNLFKDYIDKKQIDTAAERYVDLIVDYGINDEQLVSMLGHHEDLDQAINYYLDIDEDENEDDDDWF